MTRVDEEGNGMEAGFCLPGCGPDDVWLTDNTLKVTHHSLNQREIIIAVKLLRKGLI